MPNNQQNSKEVSDIELFKQLWNSRNPVHEFNSNSGEDMFWGTAELVAREYVFKMQNVAGVWVRASESLPEKEGDYFIINNGYKSVASFVKDYGFYKMGERQNKVSKWLDESKLNSKP